jgi:hypothetical protein
MSEDTRLTPTMEAIDAWIARTEHDPKTGHIRSWCDDSYMVDIRTKSGRWRCITSKRGDGYWTIRGEGSSNGCRETWVPADRIVEARGHFHPGYDPVRRAEAKATRTALSV